MPTATNQAREITLRFLAEPGEVNFGGKVFDVRKLLPGKATTS